MCQPELPGPRGKIFIKLPSKQHKSKVNHLKIKVKCAYISNASGKGKTEARNYKRAMV